MVTPNNAFELSILIKNQRSKTLPSQCRICEAPAQHSFFGVLSCNSCKMFFRRNAEVKQSSFICKFNGNCEINVNNRRLCASCRLAKCFRCGMTTDKFRPPRSTKSSKSISIKLPQRLPTLNLLQSDRSLLTKDQWTLLSNLIHAYQESQLLSTGYHLLIMHYARGATDVMYESLVQEFLITTYETTGSYLRSNDDLRKLSSNDRSIMLRYAADNVSCIGCAFIMHHCHLFTLTKFSNIIAKLYGQRSVDLHRWVAKFIDEDIVLAKLAFSLFAVIENTFFYSANVTDELTDPHSILQIQNKYAEVTWKYLLYRYGYCESVRRFVNLTNWLIALTIFMHHAQSLTLHVNDVSSLVEQIELTLILDDVDEMLASN